MTDDILAEILLAGTWTEVATGSSGDTRVADPITITRGKSELASQAGPTSCSTKWNNRQGRYSPRNPIGPHFGKLGRNTQLRIARKTDPVYDAYSNSSGTGDLIFVHPTAAAPTGVIVFVWQYNTGSGSIASVTYGGVPMERKIFGLFTLGAVNAVGYMYWLNRNIPSGPQSIIVDTTSVAMRQASAITVTGGSNAEIDNSGIAYSAGVPSANPGMPLIAFKRAHLFGSLLTDLDDGSTISPTVGFTQLGEHDIGTETVNVMRTDAVQNPMSYGVNWNAALSSWGIMSVAVRAVSYRGWFEISELPPRWDPSHKEAWVPVTAAGPLRRYQQGNEPANIGLREYILSKPQALTSYWPLSGAEGTKFSINLGNTWQGSTRFYPEFTPRFTYGKDLGAPWLGPAMEINATGNVSNMRGDVAVGETSGVALDFVWQSAAMGVLTAQVADYNDNRWAVTLNTSTDDGTAQVSFDDPSVGPIGFAATGVLAALQDQDVHHCRLQLVVDGADTDYELFIDGISVKTGTMAGYTWLGTATCRFYYTRYLNQTVMNLAHVTVWSEASPANIPSAADVAAAVHGYTGESAGDRMARVAGLAGIPLKIAGDQADTLPMGVQFAEPVLAQIRDAEATDLGVLTESRDALELMYRTRASLYNQTPKLTLDYSARTVAPPFEPVDDDAAIRNDLTVARRNGDSIRVTQTSGSLSTQAPPNGVGPYADELTVNCETDAQLPIYAGWFLNLGTLDKLRFPTLTVNLTASTPAAFKDQVLACDVGDLLRVTNLDVLGIYDDLDLIIVGYDEVIGPVVHTWTAKLEAADLYQPAVYATSETVGTARYDTYSSALVSGVTNSATSLTVSSQRTVWTTDPDSFPFDIVIGGERITVSNITGTTSPQTFSPVTRAVNGVSKAHDANADVRLFPTPRYAL